MEAARAEETRALSTAETLRERHDRGDPGVIDAIKAAAAKYRWYHRVEIVPGVWTEGIPTFYGIVAHAIAALTKLDFTGARVLDIGCRDGALSFEAERLGAREIIGIDNDVSRGLTEFLIPIRGSRLTVFECNVNDLSRERFGEFDIVIFSGVLYHLRYPIWALRRIADVMKPGARLFIEGGFIEGFDDLPVMFCPTGAGSPYEATSPTFFNAAGLRATLLSLGFSQIECVDSHGLRGRRHTAQVLSSAYPRFFWRNWWRMPRACRKIFICQRQWSAEEEVADAPRILSRYWDGTHTSHSVG